MDDLALDNPAWAYCLRLYAEPGVATELLTLQDENGLDVSLLLFCLWLGAERNVALDGPNVERIRGTVAEWAATVVHPLRRVRRGIKALPDAERPAVAAFRKAVQRVELESERVQIALLVAGAGGLAPRAGEVPDAARRNLRTVLATYGVMDVAGCPGVDLALRTHSRSQPEKADPPAP